MKWIIITTPTFISHEAKYIDQLFEAGIDLLHLRKPDSIPEECEQLLQKIDPKWYPQIVIHDHFELCGKYHLHGIHLNRRNSQIPENFQGSLSRSCHCFKEVSESVDNANPVFSSADNASPDFPKGSKPKFDYVFLSPISTAFRRKATSIPSPTEIWKMQATAASSMKGDSPWRRHPSIHSPAARLELRRSSLPGRRMEPTTRI